SIAIVVAALAWWLFKVGPGGELRPLVRFDYELPNGQVIRNVQRGVVAMSPDGSRFVYNTNQGLYLRSMDAVSSGIISGTEGASSSPFFSPDGQWIGYFADGELKKISVSGGAPVKLCNVAAGPFGASWSADGTILFGQIAGIMRVPASGGEPKLVIRTETGEV